MLNVTEIEDSWTPKDKHEAEPTWTQTVGASFDNYQATSNFLSEYSYKRDAFDEHLDGMSSTNQAHTNIYEEIRSISPDDMGKYEQAYDQGLLQQVMGDEWFGKVDYPTMMQYFTDVKEQQAYNIEAVYDRARGEAAKDYYESKMILDKSDSLSAELVGSAGGFLTDPTGIAEIAIGFTPLGAASKVGGLAYRAGTAAAKEMGLALPFELIRQDKKMDWSEEVGVKHDIKDAAIETLVAVGAAGTFRGTAEAVFDILPLGSKKLTEVDAQLAEARATLNKSNISRSEDEHIMNLDRAENGQEPVFEEPSEFVETLRSEPTVKEFEETGTIVPDMIDYDDNLGVIVAKQDGKDISLTYDELQLQEDEVIEKITRIEDCIL